MIIFFILLSMCHISRNVVDIGFGELDLKRNFCEQQGRECSGWFQWAAPWSLLLLWQPGRVYLVANTRGSLARKQNQTEQPKLWWFGKEARLEVKQKERKIRKIGEKEKGKKEMRKKEVGKTKLGGTCWCVYFVTYHIHDYIV